MASTKAGFVSMLPSSLSRAQFKAMEQPNPAFDAIVSRTPGDAVFAQLSSPEKVAKVLPRLLAEPHGPRSEVLDLTPER